MKKTFIALMAFAAISAFAANPHIKTTTKKLPDGRVMTDRNVFMNNGYFRLLQTSADGKNAVKKKWGEYFFGFEFGRLPRTNGSWSVWEFFSPWEYISEKGKRDRTQQPTMAYVPELVSVNNINGVAVADFVFPSYRGGKLKMRMMQFPSHPTWTFMRVQTVDFGLWRMDFSCYPHNSNSHKDRERHIATATKDFNLTKAAASFVPDNPYFGIYSKFLQETSGNFLIFQPEKFKKVTLPRAGACVTMQFFPKAKTNEFVFAIGYFNNKPADDTIKRFIGEDGDAVRKFMDGIEWEPKLSADKFNKSFEEAKKLNVPADKLEAVRKAFDDAVAKNDTAAAAKAEKELEELKKANASQGLSAFM